MRNVEKYGSCSVLERCVLHVRNKCMENAAK